MNKKQIYWLNLIVESSGWSSGLYAGVRMEDVPAKVSNWLYEQGFLEMEIPSNPAHKERWIATDRGVKALAETKAT